MDSVRSTAGTKTGKYHCRIAGKSRIPRSCVAPPAGFEPALPPPEAGSRHLLWCPWRSNWAFGGSLASTEATVSCS